MSSSNTPFTQKKLGIITGILLVIFLGVVFLFPQIKNFTESLLGNNINLLSEKVSLEKAYKENIPVACNSVVLAPERLGELSDESVLEKLYLSGNNVRLQLRGATEATTSTATHVIVKYVEKKAWSWEEGKTTGVISSVNQEGIGDFIKQYQEQDIMRFDCSRDIQEIDRFAIPTNVTFTDHQSEFIQKLRDATGQ